VCRTLFKQLIAAIKYLDEVKVAHRDIKMENILFDNHFNLKLSDFGLAKSSEGENNLEVLHSNVGTKAYKAPEII
jgi:serine/threonine protein kinase